MTSTQRKAGGAAAERRASQAVELFEKGVKAMGRKEYDRAREHFQAVVSGHADERDVAERARVYGLACERAQGDSRRTPYRPKSFAETLHYGVYLHNRGEFEEALKLLRQAVELQPRSEDAQYCLAATAARSGDTESALKALRAAIAANAETRAQARRDPDFDVLRDDDEFSALVYETP